MLSPKLFNVYNTVLNCLSHHRVLNHTIAMATSPVSNGKPQTRTPTEAVFENIEVLLEEKRAEISGNAGVDHDSNRSTPAQTQSNSEWEFFPQTWNTQNVEPALSDCGQTSPVVAYPRQWRSFYYQEEMTCPAQPETPRYPAAPQGKGKGKGKGAGKGKDRVGAFPPRGNHSSSTSEYQPTWRQSLVHKEEGYFHHYGEAEVAHFGEATRRVVPPAWFYKGTKYAPMDYLRVVSSEPPLWDGDIQSWVEWRAQFTSWLDSLERAAEDADLRW